MDSAPRSVTIKVAEIPKPWKDVDELLRSDGGDERYEAMIRDAKPAASWMISHLDTRHDLTSTQGAVDACEDIVDMLLRQPPIARAKYVAELAEKLGEPLDIVRAQLNQCVRERGLHYQVNPQDRPSNLIDISKL